MFWPYWKRVARRAWKESISLLGLGSSGRILSTLVAYLVAVAVLLFWGSHDAAGDMTLERTAIWVVLIVALPFVFLWKLVAVPSQIDNEKAEKIEALENARVPQIELSTTQHSMWMQENTVSISIAVTNISEATIHDVVVDFDRVVEGDAILNLPKKLTPRDEESPRFDLRPMQTRYVYLATVDWDEDFQLRWKFFGENWGPRPGDAKYKIKLKAYGDEVLPVNRFFPLSIEGAGRRVTFDSVSFTISTPEDRLGQISSDQTQPPTG